MMEDKHGQNEESKKVEEKQQSYIITPENNKMILCPCCNMIPKAEMLIKINEIQSGYYPHILTVSSGARCPQYNRKVGGSVKSAHCEGKAIDIADPKKVFWSWLEDKLDLYNIWCESPIDTPTWTHISIRPTVSGRIFRR